MEISAPWDGSTTGDAILLTPLNSDRWTEFWQTFFSSGDVDDEDRGVFHGYLDELEVMPSWRRAPEDQDVSPLWVSSGGAVVRGRWYRNDQKISVYVSIPSASTRTDRVVLRCSWAAQTVRVEMLTNPSEGTGTPPALTQSNGITWEIPLATATVTTGGAISLTDERSWIQVGKHRTVYHFVDVLGSDDGDPPMDSRGVPLKDDDAVRAYGKWVVPADYVKDMEISAIIVTDTAITGAGYAGLVLDAAASSCGDSMLIRSDAEITRVHFSTSDLGVFKAALTVRPTGLTAGMLIRSHLRRYDDGSGFDNLPGTLWCPGFLVSYVSDSA